MTIQLARRIGAALDIRSQSRIAALDSALREYSRSVAPGATVQVTGTVSASQITGLPPYLETAGTQTTVGAAGGASALPATPTGYVLCIIGGVNRAIPYYAVS